LHDELQECVEEEGETIALRADQEESSGYKTSSIEEADARGSESLPTTHRKPPPHSACEDYRRGLGSPNETAESIGAAHLTIPMTEASNSMTNTKELQKWMRSVNIKYHSFRRGGIIRMYGAGVPLQKIRALTPHTTDAALWNYVAVK
jgi:hypothetical protein